MSWSVKELVAWLDEVEPIADRRTKFDWLEIPPIASQTAIQEAYHTVARTRHPDLFRHADPSVIDRLVRMYGRVTAAYADLKEPEKCAAYLREMRGPRPQTLPPSAPQTQGPAPGSGQAPAHGHGPPHGHGPAPTTARLANRLSVTVAPQRSEISTSHRPSTIPPIRNRSTTTAPPPSSEPAPPRVQKDGPIDPAHAMNARALAFYRRAEGAQRTGDKAAALLQIKMAIAADPKSTFLRAALAELTKS